MRHHRIAWLVIASAVVLDVACGLLYAVADHLPVLHGIFCAMANGVTDGCDVAPTSGFGYVVTAIEYVTVVPLFAAAFSLFTSALAGQHVRKARDDIKQHVDQKADPGTHHDRLAEKLERLADSHDELTKTVRALVTPAAVGVELRSAPPAPAPAVQPRAPRPRARKPTVPAGENT